MRFKIGTSSLSTTKANLVVVGIFQGEDLGRVLSGIDRSLGSGTKRFLSYICQAQREESFKGKLGQLLFLPTYQQISAKRLVLLGLGRKADFSPNMNRKAAACLARRLSHGSYNKTIACFARFGGDAWRQAKGAPHTDVVFLPDLPGAEFVSSFVEGFLLGGYSFIKYKSSEEDGYWSRVAEISFHQTVLSGSLFKQACRYGETVARATMLARDLIAEPASFMTPTRLAARAKEIAETRALRATIMNARQFEKLGMGAFAGVARGAKEPAKFIVIEYKPKNAKKKVAIVGKGITFDSGGLSLKTAQGMEHMKYDMSGAAAVIAVMQVVGLMKPALSVLGVIAATENMPGSGAIHPGDILRAMNGKTIEVNNTDAEGRLVLADALAYACSQGVDEVIDIATLTGAVVTALGRVAAGVMGSHQELVDKLKKASEQAGEKLWQLPLFDEYKEALKSDIADLKNAGSRGEAGSASAAMFLKEFVGDIPWAHLDIAGPAWLDKERDECNKGGTAFGVRTLCYYLLGQQ